MSINIKISGLSGSVDVELPEGATVGDARRQANIDSGLQVRCGGRPVAEDAALSDGEHLVTAPPSAKHGQRA